MRMKDPSAVTSYNDQDDDTYVDEDDEYVNQVKQWCYCSMAVPKCKMVLLQYGGPPG